MSVRLALKGAQLAAILAQVASMASAEIAAGAVVSVTPGRIRVRSLPIGSTTACGLA